MTARPDIESLVSFLEYAPDPAIVSDDQDRIVVVNHSAESLFGYRRLEMVGRPLHELVPSLPVQTSGQPSPTLGQDTTVLAHHRDGHAMRLSVSFRAVPLEHQLLTAAYFRPSQPEAPSAPATKGLDRLPVAASRFDTTARLTYANVAAHGVLGASPERLIGKLPSEFGLAPQAGQSWLEAVQDAVATGMPRRFGLCLAGHRRLVARGG